MIRKFVIKGDFMLKVLLVFIGGGLGASARYLLSTALAGKLGNFPLGTLVINIIGCFLMGIVVGVFAGKTSAELYRIFIAVGFLGGFTTLSAFFAETIILTHAGQLHAVLISAIGNIVVAFCACVAGLKFVQLFY